MMTHLRRAAWPAWRGAATQCGPALPWALLCALSPLKHPTRCRFEETLYQNANDGTPFVKILKDQGIIPGALCTLRWARRGRRRGVGGAQQGPAPCGSCVRLH